MSHVDEGTLSGYIDGQLGEADRGVVDQHLATCEECRSLLAEEQRRADYARAILRSAGTRGSKTPSFVDVIERSRTRSGQRSDRRRLSRLASLAWAATIVVAVAVGWFARDFVPSSRKTDVADFTTARQELQVTPESNAASAPADPPAASAPVRPAPAPVQSRNDLAGRRRAAGPTRAKVAAPLPPSESRQARAAAPAKAEPAAGAVNLADRDEKKTDPSRDLAAAPPKADGDRPMAAAAETAPVPAAAPGALRKTAEPPLWIDTSEADAERTLGRKPFTIPGLAVASYSVAANGDGSIVVRQLLSPGNEVVLTERRAPQLELARGYAAGAGSRAPSSRAAAPSAARSQDAFEVREADEGVAIQRLGYSVTARGPISRDSLAVLLGKVR